MSALEEIERSNTNLGQQLSFLDNFLKLLRVKLMIKEELTGRGAGKTEKLDIASFEGTVKGFLEGRKWRSWCGEEEERDIGT